MDKAGFLLFPLFLLVGIAQIYLGFLGIQFHIATWAAVAAVVCALLLRILLPLTIGSYFGATDVMGWDWWVGVLVVLPGLIFVVPAMVMAAPEPILSRK